MIKMLPRTYFLKFYNDCNLNYLLQTEAAVRLLKICSE